MSLSLNGSGGIFGLDQGLNVTGVGTFQTLNVTGNLTVDGILTYEDVTNVESIGVITARSGIHALGDGNLVGIGTSSPESRLHIYGTHNSHIRMTNTSSDALDLIADANKSGKDSNIFNIKSRWNGTDVARISFKTGSDTTDKDDADITFHTKDSGSSIAERLRITGIGSVGIGTDDPQTILHISDNTVANARITISKFDTFRNNFIGLDNQADELLIAVDDDNQGDSSSLRLKVDGAAVGTFTGTGVSFAQDLTLPGQERFRARKQTDQNGTDNNSLWVTFAGSNGTIDYDTHNGFSESNDWYVIQNSGYFMIHASVLITSNDSNSLRDYQMAICEYDDTSNTALAAFTARASTASDDDTHSMQATFLGNLVAGRKIRLRVYGNTDTGNYTIHDTINDGIGGAGLDVNGLGDKATHFTVVKLG